MRGDLGGTGGTPPKNKFEVEDGPCIRPPNTLRSSVIGSVAKNELSFKKGVKEDMFSEIDAFRKGKGDICYICYISDFRD